MHKLWPQLLKVSFSPMTIALTSGMFPMLPTVRTWVQQISVEYPEYPSHSTAEERWCLGCDCKRPTLELGYWEAGRICWRIVKKYWNKNKSAIFEPILIMGGYGLKFKGGFKFWYLTWKTFIFDDIWNLHFNIAPIWPCFKQLLNRKITSNAKGVCV